MPGSTATFAGPAYEPAVDRARLQCQIERIRAYMLGVEWKTLRELRLALERLYEPVIFPESSISAQLRNLRKPPYLCRLEKRRRESAGKTPGSGIWEYLLLPPIPIQPPEPQRELFLPAGKKPLEEGKSLA